MSLEEMTCWGKLFQIQAAETGKAQSPTVDSTGAQSSSWSDPAISIG